MAMIGEAISQDICSGNKSPEALIALVERAEFHTAWLACDIISGVDSETWNYHRLDIRPAFLAARNRQEWTLRAWAASELHSSLQNHDLRRRFLSDESLLVNICALEELLSVSDRTQKLIVRGLPETKIYKLRSILEYYGQITGSSRVSDISSVRKAFGLIPYPDSSGGTVQGLPQFNSDEISEIALGCDKETLSVLLHVAADINPLTLRRTALEHADPIIRRNSLLRISFPSTDNIHKGATFDFLLDICRKAITDPSPVVQSVVPLAIAHYISRGSYREIGDCLLRLTEQDDIYVIQCAARFMRQCLGQAEPHVGCCEKLFEFIHHPDNGVVIRSLEALQDHMRPSQPDINLLSSMYENAATPRVRCAIGETLAWWLDSQTWLATIGEDMLRSNPPWLRNFTVNTIEMAARVSQYKKAIDVATLSPLMRNIIQRTYAKQSAKNAQQSA